VCRVKRSRVWLGRAVSAPCLLPDIISVHLVNELACLSSVFRLLVGCMSLPNI